MKNHRDIHIGLVTLVLFVAACQDAFESPSLIERTRIIGAQVQVDGDETRATPRPGETAHVRWLVTAPGDVPELGWAFVLCPAAGEDIQCAGAPTALVRGRGAEVRLDVPVDVDAKANIVVLGHVCAGGEPSLDETTGTATCPPGLDGDTAAVTVRVDMQGRPNHNPGMANRQVTLDGQPWSPSSAGSGCSDLPQLNVASEGHVITVTTDAAERESFTSEKPPKPTAAREALQISNFATAGELDDAYLFIEANDDRPQPVVSTTWDAPEDVGGTPTVVRFTFVVRDGRGGVDAFTRSLCVMP